MNDQQLDDILTTHQHTLEALRESESRLKGILENAAEGIITIDEASRILSFNPAAERIFGYHENELLGQNVAILMPNEYRREHDLYVKNYLNTRQPKVIGIGRYVEGRRKNGDLFPLHISLSEFHDGKGYCFTGIVRDMSEQKQAEEMIHDRTRQLIALGQLHQHVLTSINISLLMAESVNLIAQTLKVSGVFIFEQIQNSSDLELKAAVGCPQTLIGRARVDSEQTNLVGYTLRAYEPITSADVRVDLRFPVALFPQLHDLVGMLSTRIGHSNQNIGVLCVFTTQPREFSENEISFVQAVANLLAVATERRRTETQMHRLQNELLRVTRICAIGELGTGLAHEINQPITALINYAHACQSLLETPESQTRVRQLLDKTIHEAERASTIIQRLRDFVASKKVLKSCENLNSVIHEAAQLALIEAQEQGIQVLYQLQGQLPTISLDKIQIQQVLVNLLRNAVDALEHVEKRQIIIKSTLVDQAIEILIQDTGVGISPENVEFLFIPHFSTKEDGTGIGLSISKSIIEAHGGKIWITRPPEGGSCFHFTLPLTQGCYDRTT